MALSWSGRRRASYFTIVFLVFILACVYVWVRYFNPAPTCFDGTQNGAEAGIDCGGTCALICKETARLPQVLWARAFPNGPSTYTVAALLQNQNGAAGAHDLHYLFEMYDASNNLVARKEGVADIPPVQTVPILQPSINTGNRAIARVHFSIESNYEVSWNTVPAVSIPRLRVTTQQLSQDGTRLDATVENSSLMDAKNVTLVAILYDADDVAVAASKSTVPVISKSSSTQVTFTWPVAHDGVARTDISILPAF